MKGSSPLHISATVLAGCFVANKDITSIQLLANYYTRVSDGWLEEYAKDVAKVLLSSDREKLIIIDSLDEVKTSFTTTNSHSVVKTIGDDYSGLLLDWL